jgi:hypothetical protein
MTVRTQVQQPNSGPELHVTNDKFSLSKCDTATTRLVQQEDNLFTSNSLFPVHELRNLKRSALSFWNVFHSKHQEQTMRFTFSQLCSWRIKSSGMLYHVNCLVTRSTSRNIPEDLNLQVTRPLTRNNYSITTFRFCTYTQTEHVKRTSW